MYTAHQSTSTLRAENLITIKAQFERGKVNVSAVTTWMGDGPIESGFFERLSYTEGEYSRV